MRTDSNTPAIVGRAPLRVVNATSTASGAVVVKLEVWPVSMPKQSYV